MDIYAMRVWRYREALPKHKELFNEPPSDRAAFIVWQKRNATKEETDLVAPNGLWWNNFYLAQERRLTPTATLFLLVETRRHDT